MKYTKIDKVNLKKLKKSINKTLKKSVPLSLVLAITFNTTAAVAIIQYYFYKVEINKLVAYKDDLSSELENTPERKAKRLQIEVLPEEGVNLGIKWEDLGSRLVETGVIDEEKFLSLYKFSSEREAYQNLLSGSSGEFIIINEANSRFVLNALWALGLVQTSDVLNTMQNDFERVANLASTGGWTIGKVSAMESYGSEDLLDLSSNQQQLVMEISKNIYRPCCNNHTAFPDCNHGMAMLGLVELMVSKGYSESEIYSTALKANSYWFPDTYITMADYFESKTNTKWEDVDAKLALSREFSSGSGFRAIKNQVQPLTGAGNGGGCSV